MRVNEVEELLQISRANIRYYEKEGLLHPKRSSNGYRCYSDEDVAVLKEIIIFRKLGLSLAQIQDVQEGKVSVSEALSSNIQHLQEQIFELNGAMELCKCICADQRADTDFDREKYWTMLLAGERKGFRFMDLVNDYVSFEKRTLKSLGISGCAALFFVCAGRGLFSEFFLGQGFVFGFFYPFILFLIISALMFPIFLLSAKYKEVEIKEEAERGRRGIGWTLLKCVGMIFLLFFVTLGMLKLLDTFWFDQKVGKDALYVITGMPNFLYFFAGMYLWTVILWMYSKRGIFPMMGEEGIKAHLPEKVKRKVLCFSAAAYLAVVFIYGNWYTCVTEEGALVHHFIREKEYTWEDAAYYTLKADFDGVLKYTVRMKDGISVVCLGEAVSMGDFDEELVMILTGKFAEKGIPLIVDDWDKLMKRLKYEYWKDFTKKLRNLAGE